MTIALRGTTSQPADNGSQSGPTVIIDPTGLTPSTAVEGDLVVIIAHQRVTGVGTSMTISATGGQTWTTENQIEYDPTINIAVRIFWCRFNGTWDAPDPSVTVGISTAPLQAFMVAFQPTVSTNIWGKDADQVNAQFTGAGAPDPVSITGRTTIKASTVTIGGWFTAMVNRWFTPTGWTGAHLGSAQYRNTAGSDQTCTFMHTIRTTAGATGDCEKTPDVVVDGVTDLMTWYEEASSAIKTFAGLARASVKTVNGLALASVKTKNGLA